LSHARQNILAPAANQVELNAEATLRFKLRGKKEKWVGSLSLDGGLALLEILLKNPMNASTRLSMNGKSPMISTAPPFVLRLSKDERRVFQQNQKKK